MNKLNFLTSLHLNKALIVIYIMMSFFILYETTAIAVDNDAQSLRSPVNLSGPEAWPEDKGLSTTLKPEAQKTTFTPAQSLPSGSGLPVEKKQQEQKIEPVVASPTATPEVKPIENIQTQNSSTPNQPSETKQEGAIVTGAIPTGNIGVQFGKDKKTDETPKQEILYIDEAGNPVEKPLNPEEMLKEADSLLSKGKFEEASAIYEKVHTIPNLTQNFNERALYGISDCRWGTYIDNPLAGYEPIVSSTNEALNANLRSPRAPDALLRLSLANSKVENIQDASGYAIGLMRRFPDYPGVAQAMTALGNMLLKKGQNEEAEKYYSIVLDKYPESPQLQEASVGMAKSLFNQGKTDRAHEILVFISKRWPRYYLEEPDFLLTQAQNDEKQGRENDAMSLYWLYLNLNPKRPQNASLLLKLGDKYFKKGDSDAAFFAYSDIEQNFPDSPQALTAHMRLAEKGIYDAPINYELMKGVFNKDARPNLWQVYNEMIEREPEAKDSVLAKLKRAMWLYWDKQYPDAMGKAVEFIDSYPEHSQIPEARDILWKAFQKEMDQSLKEHNYGRILLLWNGFPYIRERYGTLDAPMRYALAQGWLERGNAEKGFELLGEFLKDPMDPLYGEAAFSQFFNQYLNNGSWDKILDLGNLVKNWKLKPELQGQLEYAMALAAQNLNLTEPALNRWKKVAARNDAPLYQKAYATYFMAKDAERRRSLRDAYELNRKVVELFSRLSDERSDKSDPDRIKEATASLMDICEVGNRIPEALQWLQKYSPMVQEQSPEYPALRFREARLYRKLGDNLKAQSLLEDIAKRFPQSPYAQAASSELRSFDVSRDLQRFMPNMTEQRQPGSSGSTSGNWSNSGRSETQSNQQ